MRSVLKMSFRSSMRIFAKRLVAEDTHSFLHGMLHGFANIGHILRAAFLAEELVIQPALLVAGERVDRVVGRSRPARCVFSRMAARTGTEDEAFRQ